VRLNHDTGDGEVSSDDLGADIIDNLGLVVVVLRRIPVTAVNHD